MKALITLCISIYCTASSAQSIATKAEQLLQAYTTQHKFSGVVLIAVRDSIVFNKAYADADIKSHRPNTVNTTFRAGSLTKMFTSALIAQLVAENKLSFDDKVSNYVSGAAWSKGITIRHLLSHTSGIQGNTPPGAITPAAMVTGFQAQTAAFSPGEKFEYNNFNFIVLSYVAEKVTGLSYPLLIKKYVLNKVGMNRSGIDSVNRKDAAKATGYTINPITEEWVATGLGNSIQAASGAGALYTTTADLFRWAKATHSATVWPSNSFQQATISVQGEYGLGWIVRHRNHHLQIGHTGTIEGFNAMMLMFPQDSVTVIYLSNLQDMNTEAFEKNLIALALGEPYEMPVAKQEIILSETQMKDYIGNYGKDAQNRMSVAIEGSKLIITAPGGDKLPLSATEKDKFLLKGPDIEVTFKRTGITIVSMFVKMGGGMLFEKVEP